MSFYALKTPDTSKKINAQLAHAERRAMERLGRPVDVKALAGQIKKGESVFMYAENHRKRHHKVLVDGQWVHVVYDKVRGVVVTILEFGEG